MNEVGSVPKPGKPKSLGERMGALAVFILFLTFMAGVAGFTFDMMIWSWEIGRSIIH